MGTPVEKAPFTLRQSLRAVSSAVIPRRRFLTAGPGTCGSLCLTYDDGPHPEHTPRLLEVLREHGIVATFFVIGRQAERHPELVRRIAEEGHAIGNHSYTHGAPDRTTARVLLDEVRQTRAVLDGIIGTTPNLFRPPFGKLTAGKVWGLWRAGQTIVLWNADPKDYRCRSSDEVCDWFRGRTFRGGDVVLLHDVWPYAADVIPAAARAVRDHGLRFTTIPEWT